MYIKDPQSATLNSQGILNLLNERLNESENLMKVKTFFNLI